MVTSKERFKLRKSLAELESHRARHTELISVYIPAGYDINKVKQQLTGEAGTARNIKSSTTRKNVQDALERMLRALGLYKQTPGNGLAIFSGNVAEREGQSDVQIWEIEPPIPLKTKVYRCDQTFFLDPLKQLIITDESYGLIVIDRQEANIALLKGKAIITIKDMDSIVPGDTRKGGQCLHPGTLIPSPDGRISEIQNINTNQALFSSDICQHTTQTTECIDTWTVSKPKQFTITTKFPKTKIVASSDHLFFVLSDNGIIEKPAIELTAKDYLLMIEKLDVQGKPQEINTIPYLEYNISKPGRNLIHNKRVDFGLLQKDLAKKVGVTRGCISAIEIGRINPSKKYLKQILNELKVKYPEFIKKYCDEVKINLPKHLDADFAQILGYFVGDGSIEKTRTSFFEGDRQLIYAYKKLIERKLRIKTHLRFRKSKNYYQLRIESLALVNFIKNEFPEIRKSADTLVPEKICKSPDDVVAGFLRGLFNAEGYVSGRVAIGMNNKKLLQQVRLLLLRFGIISSLNKYDNRRNPYSNNIRYTLEIGEKKSMQKFLDNIGFESSSKTKKLKIRISKMGNLSYVRRIPVKGVYIRRLAKKIGLLPKDFPKVSNFFQNKRDMSKIVFERSIMPIFNKRLAKLNTKGAKEVKKELHTIQNSNLIPLRIVSIKNSTGKVKLVDIATKHQNFLADGILVHNSAARFSRVRDNMLKDFFKQAADVANKQFRGDSRIKGIIIGGPGPNKENFLNGNFLEQELKDKVIGVVDIGYTGQQGLEELVAKAEDILAKEEVTAEKKAVNRFFDVLNTKPSFSAYGEKEVKQALEANAVELLLISERIEQALMEELTEKAEEAGSEWTLISDETREGVQLADLSGIAAILRFPISS